MFLHSDSSCRKSSSRRKAPRNQRDSGTSAYLDKGRRRQIKQHEKTKTNNALILLTSNVCAAKARHKFLCATEHHSHCFPKNSIAFSCMLVLVGLLCLFEDFTGNVLISEEILTLFTSYLRRYNVFTFRMLKLQSLFCRTKLCYLSPTFI